MAYYCTEHVRYRGRHVRVSFRYCAYMGMRVVQGKPLELSKRDEKKIKRLLRRQGKVKGPQCDHGCGGLQDW